MSVINRDNVFEFMERLRFSIDNPWMPRRDRWSLDEDIAALAALREWKHAPAQEFDEKTHTLFKSVMAEMDKAVEKHGRRAHSHLAWLSILIEEVGEVAQHTTKGCVQPVHDLNKDELRAELMQVAAAALLWIYKIDAKETTGSKEKP